MSGWSLEGGKGVGACRIECELAIPITVSVTSHYIWKSNATHSPSIRDMLTLAVTHVHHQSNTSSPISSKVPTGLHLQAWVHTWAETSALGRNQSGPLDHANAITKHYPNQWACLVRYHWSLQLHYPNQRACRGISRIWVAAWLGHFACPVEWLVKHPKLCSHLCMSCTLQDFTATLLWSIIQDT